MSCILIPFQMYALFKVVGNPEGKNFFLPMKKKQKFYHFITSVSNLVLNSVYIFTGF